MPGRIRAALGALVGALALFALLFMALIVTP